MSVTPILNYSEAESFFDLVSEDPKDLTSLLQEKIRELESALDAAKEKMSLTQVVKKVTPSIVRIETVVSAETIYSNERIENTYSAHGSGVVISEDGFIVTNHHVIDGAKKINVVFNSQRPALQAVVWGSDPGTDLALLKVEAKDLPYARFALDEAQIGDTAICLGNPLDFKNLLTLGVIGGKASTPKDLFGERYCLTDEGIYASYLISDAQMKPGSSGGPLFNKEGEVIGIHARGCSGISVHIDAATAIRVVGALMENRHVTRPWFGARLQFLDKDLFPLFGRVDAVEEGLFVIDTLADSPAAKVGLEFGDIIVEYGGIKPTSLNQFFIDIAARSVSGEGLALTVFRNGEILKLHSSLMSYDVNVTTPIKRLKICVEEFDADKAVLYNFDPTIKGVLVSSVELSSNTGLIPREVITGIIKEFGSPVTQVKSVDDLVNAIDEVEKGAKIFLVFRSPDYSVEFRFVVIV